MTDRTGAAHAMSDDVVTIEADATTTTTASGPAEDPTPPRSRKGIGGPKTAEGKAKASRNALKHGFRAEVHIPEEIAHLAELRVDQFVGDLQPANAYQAWMVRRAALAAAKLDRMDVIEAENTRIKREVMAVCLAFTAPFALLCIGFAVGRRDFERLA